MLNEVLAACLSREAGHQLLEFIERQCSAKEALPLLIAHNGRSFDVPFLNIELQRNGLAMPREALFFDTYRYARQVFPQLSIDPGSYKQVHTTAFRPLRDVGKIEAASPVLCVPQESPYVRWLMLGAQMEVCNVHETWRMCNQGRVTFLRANGALSSW